MHRDLKPENILLGELMHIRVIDFGDATYVDEEKNARFRIYGGDEEEDDRLMDDEEFEEHDAGAFDDESGDESREPAESKAEAGKDCSEEDKEGEALSTGFQQPPESSRAKRRGTFVGTAFYVSPEMLNESYAGPEADYWALGCILFKLLYGTVPFEGGHEN